MTEKLLNNQTIYDFCVWKYGTIAMLPKLKKDNSFIFGTETPGSNLKFDENLRNLKVSDNFIKLSVIPCSTVNFILENELSMLFIDSDSINFVDTDSMNFVNKD